MTKYEKIGLNYNAFRKADERISTCLRALLNLEEGATIADIGAGTGNYAEALAASGYSIKAIEPASAMRAQAALNPAIEWIAGYAESIPLPDASVDGVMSTLASHHFQDVAAAGSEMQRICPDGPIVVFTIDPRIGEPFWFQEYFPGVYDRLFDSFRPVDELVALLRKRSGRKVDVTSFPLPADLSDLNMHAGWNRPEIYLNPAIRAGMSGLALTGASEVAEGLDRLQNDLDSGKWDERHGQLRTRDSLDLGFVFVKVVPDA
jgi:ubiquinone/menaquinone biosynthesis C-methylase UbiE